MIEIFNQYNIDLEDNNSLDFEKILKKVLVLVKRSKYLVNFMRDKKNNLIDKYTSLEEKCPNVLNTVEPFTLSA